MHKSGVVQLSVHKETSAHDVKGMEVKSGYLVFLCALLQCMWKVRVAGMGREVEVEVVEEIKEGESSLVKMRLLAHWGADDGKQYKRQRPRKDEAVNDIELQGGYNQAECRECKFTHDCQHFERERDTPHVWEKDFYYGSFYSTSPSGGRSECCG